MVENLVEKSSPLFVHKKFTMFHAGPRESDIAKTPGNRWCFRHVFGEFDIFSLLWYNIISKKQKKGNFYEQNEN